ncbi:MAG: hypothetical protein IT305_19600 [Chloroflexi bacterium]|nr:hypothetical protein [Chloroflexota bacterium]
MSVRGPAARSSAPLIPGTSLGPYRIVTDIAGDVVGEGPVRAYRAYRPERGEYVTLWAVAGIEASTVADAAQHAEVADRTFRAVEALANLTHRSIPALLDYGKERGTCYIVTPALDAPTLAERVKRSYPLPWTLDDVIDLLGPVANALDTAHAFGVCHGRLRPASIRLPEGRQPVVVGFGVEGVRARLIGAPEPRAEDDREALAALAYELLTGSPTLSTLDRADADRLECPTSDDARPLDDSRAANVRSQDLPDDPSSADSARTDGRGARVFVPPDAINPTLSRAVSRTLTRALAGAPGERFPTAEAFVAALAGREEIVPRTPSRLLEGVSSGAEPLPWPGPHSDEPRPWPGLHADEVESRAPSSRGGTAGALARAQRDRWLLAAGTATLLVGLAAVGLVVFGPSSTPASVRGVLTGGVATQTTEAATSGAFVPATAPPSSSATALAGSSASTPTPASTNARASASTSAVSAGAPGAASATLPAAASSSMTARPAVVTSVAAPMTTAPRSAPEPTPPRPTQKAPVLVPSRAPVVSTPTPDTRDDSGPPAPERPIARQPVPVTWWVLGDPSARWWRDGEDAVSGQVDQGDGLLLFPDVIRDLDFSADVSTLNRSAALIFRAQDDENLMMAAYIPRGVTSPTGTGAVVLYQRIEGVDVPVLAVRPGGIRPGGEPVRLGVAAAGPRIVITLDAVPVLEAWDTQSRPGRLGLRVAGEPGGPSEARFSAIRR